MVILVEGTVNLVNEVLKIGLEFARPAPTPLWDSV